MSRDALFVIVEGRVIDPVFYDRLCGASRKVVAAGYQVWLIEQVNGGSGGKPGSLKLFDYCRRRSALRVTSSPSRGVTSLVFFLDRDIDHITNGRRVSPHLIYTEHADVEAEILSHGSDAQALSVSVSLDSATTDSLLTALGDWRQYVAQSQRDWIELCAIARSLYAHCGGIGLGHMSCVNVPSPFGPVDPVKCREAYDRVVLKSQYSASQSAKRERAVRLRIAGLYQAGRGWELVPGKVAARYLLDGFKRHFGSGPVDYTSTGASVCKTYLATIDFGAAWSSKYRQQLEALIS